MIICYKHYRRQLPSWQADFKCFFLLRNLQLLYLPVITCMPPSVINGQEHKLNCDNWWWCLKLMVVNMRYLTSIRFLLNVKRLLTYSAMKLIYLFLVTYLYFKICLSCWKLYCVGFFIVYFSFTTFGLDGLSRWFMSM